VFIVFSAIVSFSCFYFYLEGELAQKFTVNGTPVPPITKGTKRKGRSTLVRGKKCKIHLDSFPIKEDENDTQPPLLELIEA
jgi:hypothetical protein